MAAPGSYDLTDDEILEMEMHFGDPHARFDLLPPEMIPAEPEWDKFVTKYKCKDRIKCARPTCGTMHNEGAVVAIRDGEREIGLINIGHCCGEKLFPDQYRYGTTGYDADLRRQTLIKRKRAILDRETCIMGWFADHAPIFEYYDRRRREVEAHMPDLINILQSAMGPNGELRVRADSGKAFKEAMKAFKDQGIKVGRTDEVWTILHTVAGMAFFRFRGDLAGRAEHAKQELVERLACLRPENLPIADMKEHIQRIAELGRRLDDLIDRVQTLPEALSPANLRGIAKWLRRTTSGSWIEWEYMDAGLHRSAGGGLPEYLLKAENAPPTTAYSFPLAKAA